MSTTKTRTKTRRVEARLDDEAAELIASGAALVNESVSEFVSQAARQRAELLLARADRTLMPADQFDAMIAALDGPPTVSPELDALFARSDRITVR